MRSYRIPVGQHSAGWAVGELARATGLSVRVLRHWDEVGLVSPGRTPSGHRRYARDDVTRLYQVLALRQLGLGLSEIAALLAANKPDPRATLRRHLDAVERDLYQLRDLREQLVQVLNILECHHDQEGAGAGLELLLGAIKKMTMFEQYLRPDVRAWFIQRREQVGEQAWRAALDEWPQLIAAVRAEMDAGTDPGDARVQRLIARWDQLAELFIGARPDVRTAAGRAWQSMWNEHPEQLRQSASVAPPEMWDYVQRADNSKIVTP